MKTYSQNEIRNTDDDSDTLFNTFFGETYHSVNGAMEESMHVFISEGLNFCLKNEISVFEVGFGTGLNAFLTLIEAQKNNKKVHYTTIEKFPVSSEIIQKLNYPDFYPEFGLNYKTLHSIAYQESVKITDYFFFEKINEDFIDFKFAKKYDVVFFDAFSYDTQPEMWTIDVFKKIFTALNTNGILVTYSSKGIVKQNLREAGFEIKRLKGYKKRHMLRGVKN
ncbi:MAG: tRNA (5-methylaminomethyl-2-thiouridine)(34)-methyltransferase MnmD [Bacteroidales bacterium]|nr:tRNA (5-methylaminomethyl-2-thiouridine)(34)-methyltransferase MnmD [Bacteroidales bacterium]